VYDQHLASIDGGDQQAIELRVQRDAIKPTIDVAKVDCADSLQRLVTVARRGARSHGPAQRSSRNHQEEESGTDCSMLHLSVSPFRGRLSRAYEGVRTSRISKFMSFGSISS